MDTTSAPTTFRIVESTGSSYRRVAPSALHAAIRPTHPGYTCCEAADLSNAFPVLDRRIDYVFARGFGEGDDALKGQITLVGERTNDRVAGAYYAIWPSDHAGVVARLRLPPTDGAAEERGMR